MSVYDEELYFQELSELRADLRQIAVRTAQLTYLDEHGVPDGSVIFSNTVRRHTLKSGEVKPYSYTNAFLYIEGKKYYINKKRDYPGGAELKHRGAELYDPEDADTHLLLSQRLLLRRRAKKALRDLTKSAKNHCDAMNGMKSKEMPRIRYEDIFAESYADFLESSAYIEVLAALEKPLGIEYGPIAETAAEELKYCRFSNEIYSSSGERVRSKNELIAIDCARACGLSYQLEPFYPGGKGKRADLLIHQGRREIYVEILGCMDDPGYRSRFREKAALARKNRLPLVAIDMTDYHDANGKFRTHLDCAKLKRIFQRISLGILPKSVVTPY